MILGIQILKEFQDVLRQKEVNNNHLSSSKRILGIVKVNSRKVYQNQEKLQK